MSVVLDLACIHRAVVDHLSADGVRHCVAVAHSARDLARVYGVDEDAAYTAGLLHDWAREEGEETLLDLAAALALPVTEADRIAPHLLHARVGAVQVEQVFPGIPVTVRDAIASHTLGAAEMSPLAYVVYVADAIEPARCSSATEELRESVGAIPLDALFARACGATIERVVSARRYLHPSTVEAWNAHVGLGGAR